MKTDFEKQIIFLANRLIPRTQRQMFAFDLLHVDFADGVNGGRKVR